MKIHKKILVNLILAPALLLAVAASAMVTPTLTLTSSTDGDTVELKVSGAANANVIFYYTKTGSGLQMNYLGKTDSSGNFTTTLSTAAYGLSGNAAVYVTVADAKSNERAWPYLAAASVLSLSQTSLVLPLGQSSAITAYNNGTNYVYLSSNSNPPTVNVTIDGNKITLKAFNYGSTVVNLCAGVSAPSCASLYVTVQNTGASALVFSQNNPTVAAGQNVAVKVLGGTGTFILLNNANAATIGASLSESTVTLSTTSTSGSSAITICSSDMTACGIINAVVGNVSSSGLTFSQNNPTMNIGQSLTITISGVVGGNYSLFANTNTTAVSASVSGDGLSLSANAAGVATVTVCSSMGNCGSEVVTVNANTSGGGSISLSQNNLWLLAGQSLSLTVSGGSLPYSAAGYSENILTASFSNNNILTVKGVGAGSASVSVCSAGGGCVILSVLVSGSNTTSDTTSASSVTALSLSQTSLALTAGASGKILITGNGGYYVSTNPDAAVATVAISGSTAAITAVNAGNTNFSLCQSGGQCATVTIKVSAAAAAAADSASQTSDWALCAQEKQTCQFSGYQTVRYGAAGKYYYGSYLNGVSCSNSVFGDPLENTAKRCYYGGVIPNEISSSAQTAAKFKFSKILVYGASGNDVKELQKRLKTQGFYGGAIDGKFLTSTVNAVKKYQKSKGIKQTGNLGTLTMAALNK